MKKIESKVIGKLIQNEEFDDWRESKPVKIPFLENKKLKIIFMDFIPEDDKKIIVDSDNALINFLSKKKEERFELSALVHKIEFLFLQFCSLWQSLRYKL